MFEPPFPIIASRWMIYADHFDYVSITKGIITIINVIAFDSKKEWQTFLLQEKENKELFHRLQQKVSDGYVAFIQSHPLAEIDAEEYRPLMQYYVVEHYEEVRRFYRPMFKDKERELQGLVADNHSVHERLNCVLKRIVLSRLHPYLHHCDTMKHPASLHPITMETWKNEIKTEAQS